MSRTARWELAAVVVLLAVAAGAVGLRLARGPSVAGQGDYGYTPNPEGVADFLRELPEPYFAQAGADTLRQRHFHDAFPYRAADRAHLALYGRPWVVERQAIGDCVSWGWAHAVYVAQCVDWDLGLLAQPPPFPSTEAIYGGSRVEARGRPGDGKSPVGGYSDGSYGAAAARWVRDWGVVYREPFPALGYDLTKYSGDRAKAWGAYGAGGQGDAGRLDALAKRHPAGHVALVRTFDEAAAAIEAGFPVAVCSMQGFASTRDANGYAAASGTWAHCMTFIAVRYARNGSPDDGLLCLNSWGPSWVSGPVWPADMPAGSFWVRKATVEKMLGTNPDSFAVGSVKGFGWRDLDNGGFFEPAPPPAPRRERPAPTVPVSFSIAP